MVIIVSRIPRKKWQRLAIEALGGILAPKLRQLLKSQSQPSMSCSELVASAFQRAVSTPAEKYSLWVTMGGRPSLWRAEADYVALQQACLELFLSGDPAGLPGLPAFQARGQVAGGVAGAVIDVMAGGPILPASMVSPRHLQTSRSLKFEGCLKDIRTPLTRVRRLDLLFEALERIARSQRDRWLKERASGAPS